MNSLTGLAIAVSMLLAHPVGAEVDGHQLQRFQREADYPIDIQPVAACKLPETARYCSRWIGENVKPLSR